MKHTLTLLEIADAVEGRFVVPDRDPPTVITEICAADLMSDVLANPRPEAILLTGLTNAQSVRTATFSDLRAIVYVRGKMPDEQAVSLAKDEDMPLLVSELSMFEACGRLYVACVADRGSPGEA